MKLLFPLVGGGLVGEKEQTKQREWANQVWKIGMKMVGGLVGENETKMGPRARNNFNLLCQRERVQIN